MTDAEIAEGVKQGRPAAADALIERFAGPLVRYFSVHLPDRSLAEDMTQEVFLRLISVLQRGGAADIRSLYSLVFTIARNLALDVRRAGSRRPRWESLDEPGPDGQVSGPILVQIEAPDLSPRESAIAAQRRNRLGEALRRLPDDFREIVVLRHMEGLNGREIAELLNLPEGTVWSRLNRGLAELRDLLADEDSTKGDRR